MALGQDVAAEFGVGDQGKKAVGGYPDIESDAMSMESDIYEGKASVVQVALNIACTTVGVGMISLPIAFAQAGWAMAFVGITFGLVISVYCGRILWRALMAFEKPIPTFMDLGYEVAGKFGQIVTGISVYGTCTGASILFIILAAEQMETIFGSDIMDPKLWSLIFVGATLPFVPIKTLGHVAFISLFGALASAVVFVVVVAMCIIEGLDGSSLVNLDTSTDVINTTSPMDVISAINTFVFSFGASVIFAESNLEMRNRNHFTRAVMIAYGFAFVVYVILATTGYAVYGNSLLNAPNGNILGMLPNNWATKMCAAMLLIHLFSAFLVLLNPVFRFFEGLFKADDRSGALVWRCGIRVVIIGVCYFIAIAIPFFGAILNLMGATTITLASFTCPCWFYLAVFWRKSGPASGPSGDDSSGLDITPDKTRTDMLPSGKEMDASVAMAANAPNVRVSERYGRQIRFYEIHTLELVFVGVILLVTSALGIVGTYQAIKTIVQNASTYTFF